MSALRNVGVIHCHFHRGGVTSVVNHHIAALLGQRPDLNIALVAAPHWDGLADQVRSAVKQIAVDGLGYDDSMTDQVSPEDLSAELTRCLRAIEFHPDQTVLHWHNHSLGKNTATPRVIRNLAEDGWRFVLQIHDFAEDCRPENLRSLIRAGLGDDPARLAGSLYPSSISIGYATLTSADRSILLSSGHQDERVHMLPNDVSIPDDPGIADESTHTSALAKVRSVFDLPATAKWCVYPVRGIRRKNVGELLLLSRLMPDDRFVGITLRPTSPQEARSYQRWQDLAFEVAPRVIFDAGLRDDLSFDDNLAASDYVVSTSVAEGFGMVFLEPWLFRRRVIARRIDTVIDDFETAGMRFPGSYDAIPIPGTPQWLKHARDAFLEAWQRSFAGLPAAFWPENLSSERHATHDDSIDFAKLTPEYQSEVLRRINQDTGFRREVRSRSTELVRNLDGERTAEDLGLINHNLEVITRQFSSVQQAERLTSIYDDLLHQPDGGVLSTPSRPDKMMNRVAETHPFYPCRTEWLE